MSELKIISLGWGVQSFTLAAMVVLGDLEPVDYAVHADTGWESHATMDFAEKWTPWLESHGVKVATVYNDYKVVFKRKSGTNEIAVPAFDENGGIMRRQCTLHWKLIPVKRFIAKQLKEKGFTKKPGIVEQWIGITSDEAKRAKPNWVKYITNTYPLLTMSRNDCKQWLEQHNLEISPRSKCIICPFQTKDEWQSLPDSELARAILADELIRNAKLPGRLYLCNKRIPLKSIKSQLKLF